MTKEKLGDEHPHTLASMNRLAWYHDKLEDSIKAVRMGERCWKRTKRKLGEDHPETLTSMNSLAIYLRSYGCKASAMRL